MTILGLRRVARGVSDLARAQEFYCAGLGFQVVTSSAEASVLRLGTQEIELVAGQAAGPGGTAADLWFQHIAIVVSDMAAAVELVLAERGTAISRGGPQTLPAAAGGVTAFKFRDPEGNPLELLAFPAGRVPEYWQRQGAGYDHSAISVADAARSIAFYEALGMKVTARQVNQGPAQEALDGLDFVQVEVVALQPAQLATPHLELLCYRKPRGRVRSEMLNTTGDLLIFTGTGGNDAEMTDPDGHRLMLRSAAV